MAHNHGSIHGDDVYEQSLLAELEAAAPSAPAGASAALSPVVGEGVAEVLAQMNLDQNPPREVRSETPSNLIRDLIHKATRKRSKSLDSNAARTSEPIVISSRDHPMQLGARPKTRQTKHVATTAQIIQTDNNKKSLARICLLYTSPSPRD